MYSTEETQSIVDSALEKAEDFLKKTHIKEAELILSQLLRVEQDNVKALVLLGLAHYQQNNYIVAISKFKKVLEIDPHNYDAYNNITLCYASSGDLESAEISARKAIETNPENTAAYSNLGFVLKQKGDFDAAIACFEKGFKIDSKAYHLLGNLGSIYGQLKDIEKSKKFLEKLIECDPTIDRAYVELAHCLFLMGDWKSGWPLYEHRLSYIPSMKLYGKFYKEEKRLTKEDDVEDKTVVVYGEQGVGDLIQFSRFIPTLQNKGCKVILHSYECFNAGKKIDDILKSNFNIDVIDKHIDHDYHCSVLSLPYLLDIETPPQQSPYLTTSKKANFSNYEGKYKIGISWAGSPLHPNDRLRSVELKRFKEIGEIPGVKLFSLQKELKLRAYGDGDAIDLTLGTEDMKVVNVAEHIQDFEDTIAIMKELDLVITVDSAILHLGGACGVKTWGLLPYNPDWRWGLDGNSTIWYPSVTLFRQPKPGDWDSVFVDVKGKI